MIKINRQKNKLIKIVCEGVMKGIFSHAILGGLCCYEEWFVNT